MHDSFARAVEHDRALVAEELARARAEGRLNPAEFDERSRAVSEARTYAQLSALTADLPRDVPVVVGRRSGASGRVLTRVWLAVGVINFLVWGVISLSVGEVLHPWWVWVVGTWGVLLSARFGRSS